MNIDYRQIIRGTADVLRDHLKIPGPPFDPEKLIIELSVQVEHITFSEAEKKGYGPEFEVELTIEPAGSDPKVMVAEWKSADQMRFNIACIAGVLCLSYCFPNGISLTAPNEIDEFAAAFLMPEEMFITYCHDYALEHEGKIDINSVANEFGVSVSEATVRGRALGLWEF